MKGQVCAVICDGIGADQNGYNTYGSLIWPSMLTGIDSQTYRRLGEDQYIAFDLIYRNVIRQSGWSSIFAEKLKRFVIETDDDDNLVMVWEGDYLY